MSSTSAAQREQVYCHSCHEDWFRDEHGLTCPHCHSDFVEIIENNASDPRDDLHIDGLGDIALDPPIWDPEDSHTSASDHEHEHERNHDPLQMQWTSTGPNSYTFRNTVPITARLNHPNNGPSPASQSFPLGGFLGGILNMMGNAAQTSNDGRTRQIHYTSPTGNAHFSITTTTTGGLASRDPNNPGIQNMPIQDIGQLLQMFQPPGSGQPRAFGGNGGFDNRTLFDMLLGGGGQYAHSQEEFDRIISDLMERTQANSGAPAATEDAIESLPKKPVDKAMLGESGKAECTICMGEVDLGEVVTELYCQHWFHTDCIKAWLEQHNTCPHCRQSIEQGKAEYERKQGGGKTTMAPVNAESSNRNVSSSATEASSAPPPWSRPAPPPPGAWPGPTPPVPPPHTRPNSRPASGSYGHSAYTPPGPDNPYSRPHSYRDSHDSYSRRSRSGDHNHNSSSSSERRRSTRDYPRDRSYDRRDYERRRRSDDGRRRGSEEQENPGIIQRARDWITGHGPGHGHS